MRQNNIILLSLTGFNFNDFSELTKFRLSITVVISSLAGYFLAVESVNYLTLLLLSIGGYAMVGASNVFNQVFEKDLDKLMERTKNRPLPQNRIPPNTALFLGVFLTLIGVSTLYFINIKTAFFASISIFFIRLFVHSIKTKNSSFCLCRCFPRCNSLYAWLGSCNK